MLFIFFNRDRRKMKTNLCMRTFFIFPANINYLSTTQIDPEAELYCGKLADCVKLAPFQKLCLTNRGHLSSEKVMLLLPTHNMLHFDENVL